MVTNDGGWWLTSSEHIVSAEVPAEPSDVRAFYCDLQNITKLHPLVVSVETLHREETADSYNANLSSP